MSTMQDLINKQKYIKELEDLKEEVHQSMSESERRMQEDLSTGIFTVTGFFDGIQSICNDQKTKKYGR